jgi:hypothetical protein
MGAVVFHVSSSRNRQSIERHGLDWRRMKNAPGLAGSPSAETAGVFLARDLDEARWFVDLSRTNHESVDIWEVDLPDDFDIEAAPPPGLPYVESDGFLCTTRVIGPDRLRLHTQEA